jgi:hypothetical protein
VKVGHYLQVLEVTTRELLVRNDLDLALSLLANLDDIAKVADTAVNLYLVLEELLEGGDIEDLVACRLRSIDDELQNVSIRSLVHLQLTEQAIGLTTYLLGDLGGFALAGFLHKMILAYCITPQPQ